MSEPGRETWPERQASAAQAPLETFVPQIASRSEADSSRCRNARPIVPTRMRSSSEVLFAARRLVRLDRALAATLLDAFGIVLNPIDPEEDYVRAVARAYDLDDGHGRIADRFLHTHGDLLRAEERAWIFAQRRARFAIWRVTAPSCIKHVCFVRELTPAEHHEAPTRICSADAPATQVVVPSPKSVFVDDAFVGRLVEHEGITLATAVHPLVVRARDAALLDAVRSTLLATGCGRGTLARDRDSGTTRASSPFPVFAPTSIAGAADARRAGAAVVGR